MGMTPRLSGPQGSTPVSAVHDPQNPHADSWSSLDQLDLGDVFSQRIPTLKFCPHFLRGRLRFSFSFALRERHRAREVGDVLAETRAWKLFGLIPMMLLHRPRGSGSVGRDELCKRADEFARGHWMDLIQSARNSHRTPSSPGVERTDEEERTRRGGDRRRRSRVSRCSGEGLRNLGSGRFLDATTVGGTSGRQEASFIRVAAWLAISRVFRFRVPLSGDRGHCPVTRLRPGPLAFSLRTLHQRRVARSSDRLGVQVHPGTFPHAGSGEVAFAIANRGGSVRVWCPSGRARSPIEQLALDPEGCGPEQLALNALWPECAGRQVPQSGATCAFGT